MWKTNTIGNAFFIEPHVNHVVRDIWGYLTDIVSPFIFIYVILFNKPLRLYGL